MPMYKTEIWSGDVYEAEIYFSPRTAGKSIRRGANRETSCLKQQENNLRQARKKLARLINTNFGRKDIFVTLTYAEEPGEEARRHLVNFLRRERNRRRRVGEMELKYIAVTESSATRTHHHIIMNAAAIEELTRLWPHGRVILSALIMTLTILVWRTTSPKKVAREKDGARAAICKNRSRAARKSKAALTARARRKGICCG